MSHPDEPSLPVDHPYGSGPAPAESTAPAPGTETSQRPAGRVDAPRRVGGWGLPRLGSRVPDRLADRGRAAVEAAHASVEAARETVRETGRRLRTPGAIFGPPAPAVGVPSLPAHTVHRSTAEVGALLPRSFELPVREAQGALAPLGWTGDLYLVGGDPLRALVRRVPPMPMTKGQIASGILDTLMDVSASSDDPRTVELLDPEGQVLLRSAPAARRHRGGAWTVRQVTLADGSPVAEITRTTRKAQVHDVVAAGTDGGVPVATDARESTQRSPHVGRVWRGPVELASVSRHGDGRSLTISDLDGDVDALLVWAAVLSWWGGV